MNSGMPAAARNGAVAGLVGGLASGVALAHTGLLTAMMVIPSSAVSLAVYLGSCVVLGAIFGALLRQAPIEPGQMIFWGLTYGTLWWYVGTLTLTPLLSGTPAPQQRPCRRSLPTPFSGYLPLLSSPYSNDQCPTGADPCPSR
jgi:hypothetical protein